MSNIFRGKYRSSDDLTPTLPTSEITQDIAFTSNNITFSGMRITSDTIYYVKSDSTEIEVYNTSTKWEQENVKYSVIKLENVATVSSDFNSVFETLFENVETLEYTLHIKIGDTTYDDYAYKLKLNGTTYEVK